jgi:hypothetical protein
MMVENESNVPIFKRDRRDRRDQLTGTRVFPVPFTFSKTGQRDRTGFCPGFGPVGPVSIFTNGTDKIIVTVGRSRWSRRSRSEKAKNILCGGVQDVAD